MPAQFTWTYSKITNFEDCPKRHYECDIQKRYKEDDNNDNLVWGNYVHDAMAAAINGKPLPDDLAPYQKWIDRVNKWRGAGFTVFVEQKIGFSDQFQPAAWQAPTSWYRAKADLIAVKGPVSIAPDWKTGKPKEGSVQLGLTAQYVFAKYPEVKQVATEFVWLGHDDTSSETFVRGDMAYLWSKLLPRIDAYKEAIRTQSFPPKPGGLCRSYCPVQSCPFYRRGA